MREHGVIVNEENSIRIHFSERGGAIPPWPTDVAGSVPRLARGMCALAIEGARRVRNAVCSPTGPLMKTTSENRAKRRGRRRGSLTRDRKLLLAALRVWELKNPQRI
jgi:hypothetical protein